MAATLGKNVPKYGSLRKSCSPKYAVKFKQQWCHSRRATSEPFAL
jgi:hypothetical protein